MKVLAIRGCNLTSLAGEFEVDLCGGALRGAGVFSITGPVGSGKSTLLDALCLALFDRTPRFHSKGGVRIGRIDESEKTRLKSNDVRSVLRRGTSAGFAEVDFQGVDDAVYRARWSVRRSRGKTDGTMQTQEITLHTRDTGRAFGGTRTEVLTAIRERVGLSFDQFCRSVLLAQGDFARFLKADERDRADLLERMTGTELYGELSKAAFQRRKTALAEVEAVEAKSADMTLLEDADRDALRAREVELKRVLALFDEAFRASEAALRWHTDSVTKRGEFAAAQKSEADASQAKAKHRESGVVSADAFAAALRSDTDRVLVAKEQASAKRDKAQLWLREHGHLGVLAGQWDRWVSVLKRFRRSRAEMRTAEESLATAKQGVAKFAVSMETAIAARHAALLLVESAEKAKHEALALVSTDEQAGITAKLTRLEEEFEALRVAESTWENLARIDAESGRAAARAKDANALAETAETARASHDKRLGAARIRLEESERTLTEAERVQSLEQQRTTLEAGEPCPLCGALDHPFADHGLPKFAADLKLRVKELRAAVETHRADSEAAAQQIKIQTSAAAAAHEEVAARQKAADSERQRLRPCDSSREAVTEARVKLVAERNTLLEQQRRIDGLRRAADAAGEALEAKRTAWLTSRDQVVQIERDGRALEKQCVECEATRRGTGEVMRSTLAELNPVFDSPTQTGWQARLESDPDSFLAQCSADVLQFTQSEEELAATTERFTALDHLEEAVKVLASEVTESRFEAVLGALDQCKWKDADPMRERLQREMRRRELSREEAERIEDRLKATTVLRTERARLCSVHESGPLPPWTKREASLVAEHTRAERAATRAKGDDVGYQLRRDQEARVTLAALAPEIAKLRASADLWEQMDSLIGHHDGVKFRVFAQSLTLDCVLTNANLHLRDLAPRYRLERVPNHDLDLQVVDLDMGEDVRSVNSVSGGESFLLSLALALGLSSVSASTTRVESLFVDEGFGSLDPQTLDVALATLDALQATGRQVGVISHVTGVAERIGAQVQVTPVGPGRSRVGVVGVVRGEELAESGDS